MKIRERLETFKKDDIRIVVYTHSKEIFEGVVCNVCDDEVVLNQSKSGKSPISFVYIFLDHIVAIK